MNKMVFELNNSFIRDDEEFGNEDYIEFMVVAQNANESLEIEDSMISLAKNLVSKDLNLPLMFDFIEIKDSSKRIINT